MRKNLVILIGLVLLASSSACINQEEQISGTWHSVGSGRILDITENNFTLYDINSVACIESESGLIENISKDLKVENDTLIWNIGVIDYYFSSRRSLPQECTQSISKEQRNNPVFNFDLFTATVEEHYAFFEQSEVDWQSLKSEQRLKLESAPSATLLYTLMEETLELLKDNHAYVDGSIEFYKKMESENIETEEEDETESEEREYGDFEVADLVARNHLIDRMTEDSWLIEWGKLTDDVGLIQVKSMWLYADLDVPEKMIEAFGYVDAYVHTFSQMYEADYIEEEVKGVSKLMDQVMSDLNSMESIVIDVRFNGGGQDAVSFEILNRFTQGSNLIAKQKLRHEDGFAPINDLYIQGHNNPYKGNVYVLTSSQTGSAAEAFSIATMALDNVKRIGSATSGAMSTALEKDLPIGIHFTISNEVYMDTQENVYEYKGIPADLELGYSNDRQEFFRSVAENLDADKTQILEAISRLENE